MKRIVQLFICLAIVFVLTSCGQQTITVESEKSEERLERYEQVCVDIGVNEDGYYGLLADVEINYSGKELGYIYIDDPTLLAFCVSSERGGVWLIDLEKGSQIIDELTEISKALREAGLTEYSSRINAIIEKIASCGPFTQAST